MWLKAQCSIFVLLPYNEFPLNECNNIMELYKNLALLLVWEKVDLTSFSTS